MSAIYLDIDVQRVEAAAQKFAATEELQRKAYYSAMSKTARWLMSQSSRTLRAKLRVPAKIIRRRMRKSKVRRTHADEWRVWYGLNPIPLSDLRPRQTRKGVTAGPAKVPGAFIARNRAGKLDVFKREGEARTPIERQMLEVHEDVAQIIEDDILPDLEAKFFHLYEHELSWRTRALK